MDIIFFKQFFTQERFLRKVCKVSPAHLTNCALGETVNQSSIKYPKSCIAIRQQGTQLQQHRIPSCRQSMNSKSKGLSTFSSYFIHSWNFTNMLISHSAFFLHAKRFHFFSFIIIFHIFLSHVNQRPPPSTVGATHAPIFHAGMAGATLLFVTCQHDVCLVVVVVVVKVSLVCQLESWYIERSEIDRGIQTVAMLTYNKVN